jgi:hypothetical protein
MNLNGAVFCSEQELPSDFWASNTHGICCMVDGEPFEGPVYSYPVRKENRRYTVRRVFCSLHCAKRYIISTGFVDSSAYTLFTVMCQDVYGLLDEVVPAPHPDALKKYSPTGAGMTVEEFRAAGPARRALQVVTPPIYPFAFEPATIFESKPTTEVGGCFAMHDLDDRKEHFPSRGLGTNRDFLDVSEEEKDAEMDGA